jgi:hypothetical protein
MEIGERRASSVSSSTTFLGVVGDMNGIPRRRMFGKCDDLLLEVLSPVDGRFLLKNEDVDRRLATGEADNCLSVQCSCKDGKAHIESNHASQPVLL